MAEDNKNNIMQKIVIACGIVLGIVAFRYFDLGQYLTLEYLKSSQESLQALYLGSSQKTNRQSTLSRLQRP